MAYIAAEMTGQRLEDVFGMKVEVRGSPKSLERAKDLASRDKLQFEQWAVMRIPYMRPNEKQVGDRGVAGRGWFLKGEAYGKAIVSVKGGRNVGPGMVRDLGGTMKAEGADLGVLVMLAEPTRKMVEAAAAQGIADVGIGRYPKLQLWTIGQYFAGVKPDLPRMSGFAKAPRHKPGPAGRQARLA